MHETNRECIWNGRVISDRSRNWLGIQIGYSGEGIINSDWRMTRVERVTRVTRRVDEWSSGGWDRWYSGVMHRCTDVAFHIYTFEWTYMYMHVCLMNVYVRDSSLSVWQLCFWFAPTLWNVQRLPVMRRTNACLFIVFIAISDASSSISFVMSIEFRYETHTPDSRNYDENFRSYIKLNLTLRLSSIKNF